MTSLILLSALFAVSAESDKTFEAYPVSSPDPTAIIEAARMVLGDKGNLVYDRVSNKLLVYAPPSEQAKIADILKKTTTPSANIRIDVVVDEAGEASNTGASIGGSGTVRKDKRGTSVDIELNPSLTHQTTRTTGRAVQTLVVASGSTASFEVGREVPFSEWLIEYGRHRGYIQQSVTTRKVGTSLRIYPRLLNEGGLVAVKLVPEISTLSDAGDVQRVQFINVATELVVQDGQTVTFGGADESKEFYDRFLIGFSKEGRQKRMQMTLTPHVMKVGAPTPQPAAK